jgi:hypothetical protein
MYTQVNKVFGFATKITEINEFLLKLPMKIIASSLLCVLIFCCESVKAMEANSGSDEAIKR